MAELASARNNALPYPVYGVAFVVTFPLLDADGDPVSPSSPDSEVSKNCDTFAGCTNEAVEIATSTGICYLILTSSEMTADIVTVRIQSTGAKTTVLTLYPRKLPILSTGTCQGSNDTGDIQLASGDSAIDDTYNGCLCVATIDSVVEARIINDYVGSTKVGEVSPAWSTAQPDSDDTYTIYLPEGRQVQQANATHVNGTAQTAKDIGAINVTNLNTLSGHDPGATLGTSTLTQTQVTGGAYALNSASFAFNAALDFTTTQKASTLARVTLVDTVTTVTNQLTAAAIATGVWQDTTAGDFTAANSIGKSIMNGVSLGTGLTVNDLTTKTGFKLASDGMDSVTLPANIITATSINADAITAAKVAPDVHQEQIELSFTYDATANYAGATAGSLVKEIADNAGGSALTTDAIAEAMFTYNATADYSTADAGSVVKQIADNAGGSSLTESGIAAAVWDLDATGHQTQGTFGQAIGDPTTGLSLIGRTPNFAAGASGGLLISGSNIGTTTLGALTVTGATTLTGAVSLGSTLDITGAITATNASNNLTLGTFTVTTNAIAWNAAWDAEVQSECNDALVANFLDLYATGDYTVQAGSPTASTFRVNSSWDTGTLNDQLFKFKTGTLTTQSKPIKTSTQLGGSVLELYFDEAFTAAPTAGDIGVVICTHTHPLSQIATAVWTDTTAGDFTVASSIGKSIMNGVSLGTGLTVNDITTKTGFSISGTTTTLDALQTALNSAHGSGSWATATSVTVSDKTGFSLATTQAFNNTGTWTGNITGNLSGTVGSVTGNVGGNVVGTVASVVTKTGYSLASTGLDLVIPVDPGTTKPTFAGNSTFVQWIAYFGAWSVNPVASDSNSVDLKNTAGTSTLATHAISDDGSTFSNGGAS